MQKWYLFGLLAWTVVCRGYGEIFPPMSAVDEWRRKLEQAIAEDLERETGRKGVAIELEVKEGENRLEFSLSSRCQRDTVFSLAISRDEGRYVVVGRLRFPEQQKFQEIVSSFVKDAEITWHWTTGELDYAIVRESCADMYVEPRKEAGDNLASQLLYGMPVVVLDATDDKKFFRVEAQIDRYTGWMEAQSLLCFPKERWQEWVKIPKYYLPSTVESAAQEKILLYPGTPVAMVIPTLADQGLSGVRPYRTHVGAESVMKTARRFLPAGDLGPIEYLWGGTRVPSLDCSGFTQLVFRLNGVLLPRDADQQHQFSRAVAPEEVKPGDLIFFSKHRRHATHVGIYLGENLFIHSSPAGEYSGVKVNDLEGTTAYEKSLREIYYAAGRVISEEPR